MSSSSNTPKRSHEEANLPMISKRPFEDGGALLNSPGKSSLPSISQSNVSLEPGLDGRAVKLQRTETRDVDKQSSPLPLYRISSSAYGPSDHLVSNDGKANREVKSDTREEETNARDLSSDSRMDAPVNKVFSELKQDINVEDKSLRPDHESHSELKSESRLEEERIGLKESKEHQRTKRFAESPRAGAEEVRKEVLIGADRETSEVQEVVGENRVDLKDRERKKKDEKHRELGEREKDRSDRHVNSKSFGSNGKDFTREERETGRWEKERKDVQRDKDRKDKEKDAIRREIPNANEKETRLNEKETAEVPAKIPVQEGTPSESKRSHDHDVPTSIDGDLNDKKRERDSNSEVDRNEKRQHLEKESEDGATEAAVEREKEVFSYGIQQRRRMLRPRATHSSNREPRFRARARENHGSQGKSEGSAITYRVGECMQELLKSWKEFLASLDSKTDDALRSGPTLEIRIPAEHVTATNRQVRGGQLWGTDVYTDDSDLVAVLMHTGYCRPTASLPPPSIQELRATIRVLPPQTCYYSTLRNNVRSRAWGVGIGCSYRVEKCTILKKGGGTLDMEPCLTLISAVEPTLAPVSVERTMTTRSAASNALRQQKFVREVTVQYNLCNEPWVKYSINFVADKGLKKPLYTSARLKKGEVIYLETHFKRYELCYIGEKPLSNGVAAPLATEPEQEKPHHHASQGQTVDKVQERGKVNDVFRWSLCKKPLPQEVMRSIGIPLPVDHLEVLEENLEWEEVQWSQTGVWVAGKEYPLARVHFLFPS